ncbi:DNA topoisomerase 1 [Alphaproteobacteria bacterium]|nr:DNA topoisomerase 1 [Alphaproteobacteria bacterium]
MKEQEGIIIVESPAKATTIELYLGGRYTVLASYGHVRDLVNKTGSVDPERDFAMLWGPTDKSRKPLDAIFKATKGSSNIFLATDPDREGEAIAWHISELITDKYKNKTIQRVVFYEITKNAVTKAMEVPRQIDNLLVDAYLARRALDYLVGYSLSPILWQKLPGARSAGRVQSVALRLIVEREQAIEAFNPQEYWTLKGEFSTEKKEVFQALLVRYDGKKIEKFSVTEEKQARAFCKDLQALRYAVSHLEKKQVRRYPAPPFTTSTLQQEASRKLGFGASRTMRTAQRLYEGISVHGEQTGLITYMRTDSVNLSQDALAEMRPFIEKTYGPSYVPETARLYKTKAKNAQEAHEAIRPTSILRRPEDVSSFLDGDQNALYELIWKRALASQMESAVFDQVTADIADSSGKNVFHAVGTTQIFDGFLRLYQEGKDEGEEDEETSRLPVLQERDAVDLIKPLADQHFTQQPPRFTEASLVKNLEELGIGRPSTYAPLMQVLQDREYVTLTKRQFHPSDRGRLVTAFLTSFCEKYVEYDFTAHMEEELDDIASGTLKWKAVMNTFWKDFSAALDPMKSISIMDVIEKLESILGSYLFKTEEERTCSKCQEGRMGLRLSKFGAFLGCNHYPECQNRRAITLEEGAAPTFEPVDLGVDPTDSAKISLRRGPYGFYIQFDFPESEAAPAPVTPKSAGKGKKKTKKNQNVKRVSLPQGMDIATLDLGTALALKALPKTIGEKDGQPLHVNSGRFGPYVKWGNVFASIPKSMDFLTLSEETATQLIEAKVARPQRPRVKTPKLKANKTTSKSKTAAKKKRPGHAS